MQIILDIIVEEYYLRAIVDYRAKGNFILKRLTATLRFATIVKQKRYSLITANSKDINENGGIIKVKTNPLVIITTSRHQEKIIFNIIPITHLVILG